MNTVLESLYTAAKKYVTAQNKAGLKKLIDVGYKFYKEGIITEEKFVKFQGRIHKAQVLGFWETQKTVVSIVKTKPAPRNAPLSVTLGELYPQLAALRK